MKVLVYLILLFTLTSCSTNKVTFWCGDHPCINNAEKEAYFKKTMIVEIRDLEKKTSKNNSEIEKIILQAQKKEKIRIKKEKYMNKQSKLEDKRIKKEKKKLAKQAELEAKRIEKEEKNLAKQAELEAKRIEKEEKNLAKQAALEAKRVEKEEKNLAKKIEKKEEKIIKKEKKKELHKSVNFDADVERQSSLSLNFNKLVEKITNRNISRPYPDINDIQD